MQLKTTNIGTVSSEFVASSNNYASSTTVPAAISSESVIGGKVLQISSVISGYVSLGNIGIVVPSSTLLIMVTFLLALYLTVPFLQVRLRTIDDVSIDSIGSSITAITENVIATTIVPSSAVIGSEVSTESSIYIHFVPSSIVEMGQLPIEYLSPSSIVQFPTSTRNIFTSESFSSSTSLQKSVAITAHVSTESVTMSKDIQSSSDIHSQSSILDLISRYDLSVSNVDTGHLSEEIQSESSVVQLKTTKIGTVSSAFAASSTNYVSSTTVTGAISTESVIGGKVLQISNVISGYVSLGIVGNVVLSSTPNYVHLSTNIDSIVSTSEISTIDGVSFDSISFSINAITENVVGTTIVPSSAVIGSEVATESSPSNHFIPSRILETGQLPSLYLSPSSIVQLSTSTSNIFTSESFSSSTSLQKRVAITAHVSTENVTTRKDIHSSSDIHSQSSILDLISRDDLSASNVDTGRLSEEIQSENSVVQLKTTKIGAVSNAFIASSTNYVIKHYRSWYYINRKCNWN